MYVSSTNLEDRISMSHSKIFNLVPISKYSQLKLKAWIKPKTALPKNLFYVSKMASDMIEHVRIHAISGFVLKQEGNNAVPKNQGDKGICSLRYCTPVNTASEPDGSSYFYALY